MHIEANHANIAQQVGPNNNNIERVKNLTVEDN